MTRAYVKLHSKSKVPCYLRLAILLLLNSMINDLRVRPTKKSIKENKREEKRGREKREKRNESKIAVSISQYQTL